MNKYLERIHNGVVTENPTFILMLGLCPTLAVSTAASNGIGMGIATTAVLILSNLIISALRKVIPDEVRLPAYIVIVATLVTIVELLVKAYVPALYSALGIYIPLIVVNCIILGRAEAYANKNSVGLAIFDGIGMGLGFTIALTVIGFLRELLGNGTVFGHKVLSQPIGIFIKAPGAFLVMAVVIAVLNALNIKNRGNELVSGCDGCCANCAKSRSCGEEAAK